jgi:hypothetical protein
VPLDDERARSAVSRCAKLSPIAKLAASSSVSSATSDRRRTCVATVGLAKAKSAWSSIPMRLSDDDGKRAPSPTTFSSKSPF